MGWPVGETFVNNYDASKDTTAYVQEMQAIPPADREEDLSRARDYNEALAPAAIRDPWGTDADQSLAGDAAYTSQLSRGEAFARVRIPEIQVDLPVYHGTTKAVLDKGAGHMFGTDLPVGGPGTHAVIAAHTGMRARTYFDRLPELVRGKTFMIDVYGQTLTYLIDQISVVEPWELDAIAPVAGQDYVTLVTCFTPPRSHRQRMLVRGHRVPNALAQPGAATRNDAGAEPGARAASNAGAQPGVPESNSGAALPTQAPVTIDTSIQAWMWPRIAASGGAVLLVILMGIAWGVSDRLAARRGRRLALAQQHQPTLI